MSTITAAEQAKQQGNEAFKRQDYPLALSLYSKAKSIDPSISTYPLNRSLVYLKLHQYKDAIKDATTALELEGGVNVKALFRRATANRGLGRLDQAKKDLELAKEQGAGQDVDVELTSVIKQIEQEKENSFKVSRTRHFVSISFPF